MLQGKHRQHDLRHFSSQHFFLTYLLGQGKQKTKNKQMDYIKLKGFCTAQETLNKMKRQLTEWENIFASTSDTGLISKIL